MSSANSGDVLLIYGGDNISVTRSGTSFTIDYDGPSPTPYYFNIASSFDMDTVTRVDSGDSLVIYGGSNISVTRSGGYFNIAYDGPVPTAYDFKVAEGVFSTPHTINSGDSLVLYGGDGISVTRSGAAFTFAATGSYLPLSAGSAYPLSGPVKTEDLIPNTDALSYIGTLYHKYRKAYFAEAVYVSSDLRLKEDVTEAPGLGLVNRLKPLAYRLKDAPDKKHWGFGAQDVAKVCDSDAAVVEVPDEGPQGSIAYTELMAPMVKAIQELSERLEAIENG